MSTVERREEAVTGKAGSLNDLLADAENVLANMARGSLPDVADLAQALCVRAHDAGADKISEAANQISHAASGRDYVSLAAPMRQLEEAISEERETEHV